MSFSDAIDQAIREVAVARAMEEDKQAERDLLSIPGVKAEIAEVFRALDLEVIHQIGPDGLRRYRGIAKGGAMQVDHFPEWGPLEGLVAA